MISVGFEHVSKNVRVGFVANPLIVAFEILLAFITRRTKWHQAKRCLPLRER